MVEQYPDLHVILYPSSDFLGQEFVQDSDIASFVANQGLARPNVTLLKRGNVIGDESFVTFAWIRSKIGEFAPKWNFAAKFVLSATGELSKPKDIEAELAALTK